MKNILKPLLSLLATLIIACCASSPFTPSHSPSLPFTPSITSPSLSKDQIWQLVKLQGRTVPPHAKVTTLSFNPEAQTLRGQTPCNTYSADYSIQNSTLTILNLQSSSLLCPEADINAQSRYLATLKKCTQITINSTTLTLGNKNKVLLVFELQ